MSVLEDVIMGNEIPPQLILMTSISPSAFCSGYASSCETLFSSQVLILMYLLKSTLYFKSFVQPDFHSVKSSSFTRPVKQQHHWKQNSFVLCFAQLGHSTFKILIKDETNFWTDFSNRGNVRNVFQRDFHHAKVIKSGFPFACFLIIIISHTQTCRLPNFYSRVSNNRTASKTYIRENSISYGLQRRTIWCCWPVQNF